MLLKRLNITSSEEFEFVEKLYLESFPIEERRNIKEFRRLISKNEDFTLYIISDNDKKVGFLTFWTLGSFIYIEHFAISSEFRNGGYGKKVMEAFILENSLPILLEVELPETDLAKRRIGFYERLGFRLWNIEYKQPPYNDGYNPIPMKLMSYGVFDLQENFQFVRSILYKKVYNIDLV